MGCVGITHPSMPALFERDARAGLPERGVGARAWAWVGAMVLDAGACAKDCRRLECMPVAFGCVDGWAAY